MQEAAGAILITAGQGQHPAGRSIRSSRFQQSHAHLGPEPIGQLRLEIKPGQREDPLTQLGHPLPHRTSLTDGRHGFGIGGQTGGIHQPMQAEGRIPGHKTGRPRQGEGAIDEAEWTLLDHRPADAKGRSEQNEGRQGNGEQKWAGLHGPAGGHMPSSLSIRRPLPGASRLQP